MTRRLGTCQHGRAIAAGLIAFGLAAASPPARADPPVLRVCASEDSLPFSNRAQEGFENKIATLVARVTKQRLVYVWTNLPAARALNAGMCDAVMTVPAPLAGVETTRPYYASSYAFVTREDRNLNIASMKDGRLKALKIGVEALDGGRFDSDPGRVLVDRGLARNLVRFPVTGEGAGRGDLFKAVARGDIDAAVAWGPVAGYFADRHSEVLAVTPITETEEFSSRDAQVTMVALQYDIAMAVRKGDTALRRKLDAALLSEKLTIREILKDFGVPLVKPSRMALRTDGTVAKAASSREATCRGHPAAADSFRYS